MTINEKVKTRSRQRFMSITPIVTITTSNKRYTIGKSLSMKGTSSQAKKPQQPLIQKAVSKARR